MNKTELIAATAELSSLSKRDCEAALNAALDAITNALKQGEKVQLVGFGSFETKYRPERTGHNPRSGEEIVIAACNAPVFKAGKALKDAINE